MDLLVYNLFLMIRHIFMDCNNNDDYDLLVEMIIGVDDTPI